MCCYKSYASQFERSKLAPGLLSWDLHRQKVGGVVLLTPDDAIKPPASSFEANDNGFEPIGVIAGARVMSK